MEALPQALQHDLHAEVRGSILVNMQFFQDLGVANPRILRQLGFEAMSDILAVRGESVFAPGDGSHCMFFVDYGALVFCTVDQIKDVNEKGLSPDSSLQKQPSLRKSHGQNLNRALRLTKMLSVVQHNSKEGLTDGTMLGPNDWVSEPALWSNWEHRGELTASVDSTLLALNADSFYKVISSHTNACIHAVKYCRHLVWYMNHGTVEVTDLFYAQLPMHELDCELFAGSEEDHFVFISHYKKEAGTEATLLQGELERLIRADTNNLACELRAPVFLDSENLADLKALRGHVRRSSHVLLLLTPDVLKRPWCLIEIVIARREAIPVLPVEVLRPGDAFEYPTEEFYEKLRQGQLITAADQQLLQEEGIDVQELEAGLKDVFTKIATSYSPHRSVRVRSAELNDIMKRLAPMRTV